MERNIDKYVGRIVRLNQQTFREVSKRAIHQGVVFENCFVVAEVRRQKHQLICYGADLRIIVGASNVVLI